MISQRQCLCAVLLVAVSLVAGPVGAAEPVSGEFIIRLKSSGVSKVHQKLRGKAFLKGAFAHKGLFHLTSVDSSLVEELKADPEVLYVEPNYILSAIQPTEASQPVSASSAGAATYSQTQAAIYAEAAWDLASAADINNRPIVAVVDTGLDSSHPVFTRSNSVWINPGEIAGNGVDDDFNGYIDDVSGWNFISNRNNFFDDEGHGTHVAGIVLGATQDIVNAPSIEAKIRLMPLKFLDANGSGSTSGAINAIYYAVNMGAKVINCSWGGGSYSRALHDAITYAYEEGTLVVTAAGNYASDNNTVAMYPANYDVPSNLAIAATTDSDRLASFSNFGTRTVHLASPGVYVFSTLPGGWYGSMSGTSMAAPLVAGAAALAFREASAMTGYQMKELILASATPVSGLANSVKSSSRINMETLIQAAQQNYSATSFQPSYSPKYQSERSPASESGSGGGGCGTIQSLTASGLGFGGRTPPGSGIAGLLLLMAPFMVWWALRRKTPVSRRRHDRFLMNSEVVIKAGERELVASLKTISMGGLSFNVDEALEKGGTLQMQVIGPDGQTAIEVEGHIVWSEKDLSYGVQFDSLKEQARGTLFGWTQNLTKASS